MNAVVGGSAFHFSAAGTADVAAPGGILHAVSVNTGASGASVDIRDGSSGNTIATIDASAARTLTFDVQLKTGLHVVVTGTPDVTVVVLPSPEFTP